MLKDIAILYVEDDKETSEEVQFFLKTKVKKVYNAYDAQEGYRIFKEKSPDVIITDIRLPKFSGLELVEKIRNDDVDIPVIIVSAFNEVENFQKAIELKVDGYLMKPTNLNDLFKKVEKLTKSKILQKELHEIKCQQMKQSVIKYQRLLELSAKASDMTFWEFDVKKMIFIFNDMSYSFLHFPIKKESNYTMGYEEYMEKFIPEESREFLREILSNALKKEKDYIYSFEHKLKRYDGKVLDISATAYFAYDTDGKLEYIYGIAYNIGKIKATQNKLERYTNMINQYIPVATTDLEGKIISVSDAFVKLCGYSKDELIGKTEEILKDKIPPENLYANIQNGEDIFNTEVKKRKKDGTPFWIEQKILPIHNESGKKTGYMQIAQDITDKKRIEKLSVTDILTGLYNRRYFNKILPLEINRKKREKKEFAFLMIDVDYFKRYNDLYGHPAGDKALIKVSEVFRRYTNRAGDYAFRMGGEEFALILGYEDIKNLKEYVNNILESIENLQIEHSKNPVSRFLSVSIGVSIVHCNDIVNSEDIYKMADDALYKAKENGRNQICYAKANHKNINNLIHKKISG